MVSSYLEISTGSKNRMYTLWKHSFVKGITPTQKFIKNLSISYEQALEEAKGIAEKLQLELIEGESGLDKIIRKDSGLVYFGKHRGKSEMLHFFKELKF